MSDLVVANDHEALRTIGPWVADVLESIDAPTRTVLQPRVELAVHELASNSVDHSNSPDDSFMLHADLDTESLRVVLIDRGDPVDLSTIPEPDLDQPQIRGYGMMIVEQLVTRLDYRRVDHRNVWTATFDITPADPVPPQR